MSGLTDTYTTNIPVSLSHPVIEASNIISATGRVWNLREADGWQVEALMQQHDVPEMLARILVARGLALEEAEAFLNPSLKISLPDPLHLLDMDVAVQRLVKAVMDRELIAVFGDYDVDGATSSALLMRYFRALGCDPMVYIPDRMKEGYGPNASALLELQRQGVSLVITVDCGTLAFEPLTVAHEAGLDVIVIDHHIGEARRPKAFAIVNPNRLDESSPYGQLAAAGVTFLLMVAMNRCLRERGFFTGKTEPDLRQWLDLVALGTVCDVVPLTGINRALVAQGLKIIAARGNIGIRTLLDMAKADEKPGVYACGFVLGPRINAGGRVGKSDLGVRLLTTEDAAQAQVLAAELEQHNAERKAIEAAVQEEAQALAERVDASVPLLVIVGKGWHQGVIGIVAGRLKERFYKPTMVIAVEGGIGKGSARSVAGFDIGAAVIAARDAGLLLAGGGHAMAAGFTVEEDKIPALATFLETRFPQARLMTDGRKLQLDAMISIAGVSPEMALQLERLGPFGQGNAPVRLAVQNVINLKPEIVGEQHVKTLLIDRLSNARLSAIAFRCIGTKLGDALLSTRGKEIMAAGQLRLSVWSGKQTVSLHVDDIVVI